MRVACGGIFLVLMYTLLTSRFYGGSAVRKCSDYNPWFPPFRVVFLLQETFSGRDRITLFLFRELFVAMNGEGLL